tara:strand:- start:22480 stop:23178 length:699 start_codon:yes stop_codon:yes gene_type:complete
MSDSLLPANASALERAFERAFQELLYDIDAPFPQLLDPHRTPAVFLPYLASDRGVSEWVSGASDDEKRRTIAAAWPTKRLAGTGEALQKAVESLGFSVDLTPWHEQSPRAAPFTIQIDASSDETIDEDKTQRLMRRITNAQAERDALTLRIVRTASLSFSLAGYTHTGANIQLRNRIDPRVGTGQTWTASALHRATTTQVRPAGVAITLPDLPLYAGGGHLIATTTTIQPRT